MVFCHNNIQYGLDLIMTTQRYNLERIATTLTVEVATAVAGSPVTWGEWTPIAGCKVDSIVYDMGIMPSRAVISFPAIDWHISPVGRCDKVRVKAGNTILFSGISAKMDRGFSGNQDSCKQHLSTDIQDIRWLMAVSQVVFGQYARLASAYQNDMKTVPLATVTTTPTPAAWLLGRRCIFNDGGRPNKDVNTAQIFTYNSNYIHMPVFTAIESQAEYWTARRMIDYILKSSSLSYSYFPYLLTASFADMGLDHSDFDTELASVSVDGMNMLEAIDTICRQLGWSFRIDWDQTTGGDKLVFFKRGSSCTHSTSHEFYAANASESILDAITRGDKILAAMEMTEDITPVINQPVGLGGVHKFEVTLELVPGWLDSNLVPDISNLFFTEKELKQATDPNAYTFYQLYHSRGDRFRPFVGRRWALNESGKYSGAANRGDVFDFSTVIGSSYVTSSGQPNYAPFTRRLKQCLSYVNEFSTKGNRLPVKLEFSFDGGATWHKLDGLVEALPDELGILITQPNLSDIYISDNDTISGGTLDGIALNYWTSLCRDKLIGIDWTAGWHTRCRITCTVEMDQRLISNPSANGGGSLFKHQSVYDLSDRYPFQLRQISVYSDSYPSDDLNLQTALDSHISQIRKANQDKATSGRFVLDFLWWDSGGVMIKPGDLLERITGRTFELGVDSDGTTKYPEVAKVTFQGDTQQLQVMTRDVRLSVK